nr:STAS domain-containing protein [Streptomyces sp. NBC_00974]
MAAQQDPPTPEHVPQEHVAPDAAGPDPVRPSSTGPNPETVVVRLSGEMDITRVSEVRTMLLRAVTRPDGPAEIVIDLSDLTFCDSSGLNALLRARLEAVESGHTLRLAAPSHQMLRLLELTGTLGLFPIDAAPPA